MSESSASVPIVYLTFEDILAIHTEAMKRTGSLPAPLRSSDLLAGAIQRPQNKAYYEGADLFTQACTLIIAISQAQAFLDGNKRTALQAGLMFLDLNGFAFTGDAELLAVLIEESPSSASQEQAIEQLVEWVRPYLRARDNATQAEDEE